MLSRSCLVFMARYLSIALGSTATSFRVLTCSSDKCRGRPPSFTDSRDRELSRLFSGDLCLQIKNVKTHILILPSLDTRTNQKSLQLPLIRTPRSWLGGGAPWGATGSLRSECWYRSGELDVGLIVSSFVLLVFVDVHLPDNPGIINRQLLPQIIFLFPFVPLLSSLIFPEERTFI